MNRTISREEQICLEALELDDAEKRRAFVKRACGENFEMQTRVMELVKRQSRQGVMLDQTADSQVNGSASDDDPIAIGAKLGPYKILQKIGAGGMGVVYMAEQTEPDRRKVAIKIIRTGMDSKNVIARFEAERRAMAMMDHPNITKVYDAGVTETGRPFFVMELITGVTITKYCDQRKLDLRQRMEIFFKVCHAVQHAHQKGVIHRDIKPSNIMVTHIDGVTIPKVIDFGIAKAIDQPLTEKTLFTSYGNIIGTPEYMSPEQAEMSGQDIDTCSDVYSLGVLLYELMTGTTPFYEHKKSGLRKICDAICTEEPQLASTRVRHLTATSNEISENRKVDARSLKQFLRGEVDWIIAKCLAKKREDRYSTAADLACDIRRCLDGEPVLAAAPSKRYRFKKFVKRHRYSVAAGTFAVASLLIATCVAFAFAARAINAEQLVNRQLQETEKAQLEAEIERDRALAAEAKLRELERSSRREAANAQAIAMFINQLSAGQSTIMAGQSNVPAPCTSESEDKEEPTRIAIQNDESQTETIQLKQPVPFKISVSQSGRMSVEGNNGSFAFEFASPADGDCPESAQSNCIQYKAEGVENQEYAKRVLTLVSQEMQKRFGDKDKFVIEPKMLLADMDVKSKNWAAAEKHLREVKNILMDKEITDEALQCKNALLLAMTLAKQNKKAEARQLIEEHIHELSHNKEVCQALNEAVAEIRDAFDDAKDDLADEFDLVADELSDLGDEMTNSIVDSLKQAFKSKNEVVVDSDDGG